MYYTCDPGFILQNLTANLVICLSTGEWSALPSCLSKLENGKINAAYQLSLFYSYSSSLPLSLFCELLVWYLRDSTILIGSGG